LVLNIIVFYEYIILEVGTTAGAPRAGDAFKFLPETVSKICGSATLLYISYKIVYVCCNSFAARL
jgi:hypothetical protein